MDTEASQDVMRYLVVANLTGESPSLCERVRQVVQEDDDAEFVILVPTHPLPLLVRLAGVTDRVQLGRRRALRARQRLEAAGARVTSVQLALHEPIEAVEAELRTGRYQGVIISTLPHPFSHWLRRDLPGEVQRRHPELHVSHVVAPATLYEEAIARSRGWQRPPIDA